MIIFNESLTTVVKTENGYIIKSPLYSFNSNTIPDTLTLETITQFIQECRHDKLEDIKADFIEWSENILNQEL